jgi:hypothetical protein
VHLDCEKPFLRIERTWCSKSFRFYPPKTAAGRRTVPISAWLAALLRVLQGGRDFGRGNQPDVRKPIENVPDGASKEGTSD